MSNPQTPEWNTDEDVEQTPLGDRHVDPTIPTLVLPKPTAVVAPAFPKAQRPYVLSDDELAALPTDEKNIFKEMVKRNPFPGQHPKGSKTEAEWHELRKRYGQVQQIPIFKPTDAELVEMRAAQSKAIVNAESDRIDLATRTKAALANDAFLPVIPERDLPDVLIEFLGQPEVIAPIVDLRRALAAYQVQFLEAFIFHSPENRKREQKIALQSNTPDEAVNRIMDEIVLMGSEHFRLLANRKAGQLNALWHETVRPKLVDLLQSAELYVSEQKLSALQNAAEFLRANDADEDEAPRFTKKYDVILTEIKNRLNHLVTPGGGIPRPVLGIHVQPVECALQHVFGIPVLPAPIDA